MTTACPHCGAILRAGSTICSYCDSRLVSFADAPILSSALAHAPMESGTAPPTRGNLALEPEWRAELSRRVDAYRKRHRRAAPENQTQLPFDSAEPRERSADGAGIAVDAPPEEEFAFTMAIGRHGPAPYGTERGTAHVAARARSRRVERVDIDLTAVRGEEAESAGPDAPSQRGLERFAESHTASPLFPVAPLGERATAAMVDALFLLFSYGGFLALFSSFGGQFSFSELNAIVYVSTFALFYLQYFALFTVFGGTTPGMMLRRLHVVSSACPDEFGAGPDGLGVGDRPSSRQLLLRSLGYVLSAGTFLLGFAWACWDEDHLTWHDRISRTYLTSADVLPSVIRNAARDPAS